MCVVIIKKSISRSKAYYPNCPHILRYKTHADKGSLYHTPNVFGIYMLSLMGAWLQKQGGLTAIQHINQQKADALYHFLDQHPDIFVTHAQKASRSTMNVTFSVGQTQQQSQKLTPLLTKTLQQADMQGFLGHRSVGGFRISLYNSIPYSQVEQLIQSLQSFIDQLHG